MSDTMTGGAPSGAAAPSAQAQTIAAMQQGQQSQAQPQGQSQEQPSEFATGFLGQVDPAHRSIVEPYIGKWDAGVTRRFQELHGQLQPYQALGADPDTLGQALQLFQMVDNDPQSVLSLLQELVGGGQQQAPGLGDPNALLGQQQPQGLQGQPPQGQPGQQPPGLPPEVQQQLAQLPLMQQVLEQLAQGHLDQQRQAQEAQEDAQLDQYLSLLKKEYGDWDANGERFIIAQMMSGMDGEQAVQAYHQAIQGQVNARSQRPNVPPILGGGGSVPPEGQRIAQASRKDTKSLVANILAQSAQS